MRLKYCKVLNQKNLLYLVSTVSCLLLGYLFCWLKATLGNDLLVGFPLNAMDMDCSLARSDESNPMAQNYCRAAFTLHIPDIYFLVSFQSASNNFLALKQTPNGSLLSPIPDNKMVKSCVRIEPNPWNPAAQGQPYPNTCSKQNLTVRLHRHLASTVVFIFWVSVHAQ